MKSIQTARGAARILCRLALVPLLLGSQMLSAQQKGPGASNLAARTLVKTYCTACHIEPQPADLPREEWPIVVYWMAHYVGLKGDEFPDLKVESITTGRNGDDYSDYYRVTDPDGRTNVQQIFRDFNRKTDTPPLTNEQWNLIRSYFVSNARPRAMMRIERPKNPVLPNFTASVPNLGLAPNGLVFSVLVDEPRNILYVGRGIETRGETDPGGSLYAFDLKTSKQLATMTLVTDPQDMQLTPTGVRVSLHGTQPVLMTDPGGKIIDWSIDGRGYKARMLANKFARVTETHTVDMDADGREDIVVTNFADGILSGGGGRGALTVLWETPEFAKVWRNAKKEIPQGLLEGAFTETVLLQRAGMIGSAVGDFNNDGKPDIALLTAQAQQQILLFVNKGNREFEMHTIVERTPSFGHISIKAGDFNNDGKLDLIVLNGNNVELVTPRPQHGIRVFENNGDLTFTERFEYPMHGASRAALADFDGDGDLDVAAISIWPDWELAEPETFVYLENTGNWNFKPYSMESGDWGVWMDVETGDVNADGKPDIVLGLSNFRGLGPPEDWLRRDIMKDRDGKAPTIAFLLNRK